MLGDGGGRRRRGACCEGGRGWGTGGDREGCRWELGGAGRSVWGAGGGVVVKGLRAREGRRGAGGGWGHRDGNGGRTHGRLGGERGMLGRGRGAGGPISGSVGRRVPLTCRAPGSGGPLRREQPGGGREVKRHPRGERGGRGGGGPGRRIAPPRSVWLPLCPVSPVMGAGGRSGRCPEGAGKGRKT